jgi:tetratricopeptide (TPR) repeat protein
MSVIDLEERRLEKLAPVQLSRHLMRLPVKKRLDLILSRTDAQEVVAAMPVQDFFISIQELGPEDALPLLALARVEQINHLFDLEWWHKDRIQPAKAVEWLERLSRASDERLLAWLYVADFELLTASFKGWIGVYTMPEDDTDLLEAREQLPKNTLDDTYYWEARYPQYEDFLRRVLSLLFEVNFGFYKELMNHVLWALDVEVEEAAYRFHRGRLEDEAIPDYYDALEIYRSIRQDEIGRNKSFAAGENETSPAFALALIQERDLLSRALERIQDVATLDALQWELASLANKVVVADQVPYDSPEALHGAVDKVGAYVSLGLDLKTGGNLDLAVKALKEVLLEHLFRLAPTQVMKRRERLRVGVASGWRAKWPLGI